MQQSSAGVFTAIDAPLFPWVQNSGAKVLSPSYIYGCAHYSQHALG